MNRLEMDKKLNELYAFMLSYTEKNGFPPSVRDVCENLNIKSTASAYVYINKLKERKLIEKVPSKKRALIFPESRAKNIKTVPLLGVIRAGEPILATENFDGYCPLPPDFSDNSADFALRVTGDSMVNAGICDKDIIIVRAQNTAENGEIVVALVDDAATVKRLYRKDGKIILHPENDTMQDMIFDTVTVLGKVVGLYRNF